MATSKEDRKFMELAIEEMIQSRSEHSNKYDPLVGAVLVGSDGTVLGKTFRGSLREGDHAEFTLIERYLRDANLEGSTLYVTLEPCTTRSKKKTPCAERIVSARIKRVFIGMLDPDPRILGRGVRLLQKHGIEVDFFDHDLYEKISEENKGFIEQFENAEEKVADTDELATPSEKEKEPVVVAVVNDLSIEVIKQYLEKRKLVIDYNDETALQEFLHKNDFVTKDTVGRFVPTTAGFLLFGKTPEDSLTQSKVKIEAHKGVNLITQDIGGPLLQMPDKIKDFLNNNMQSFTVIHELRRTEVPEYPWEAVREAVVNAIVHRDYREGVRVSISLQKDRLIIKSPGLPTLSLDRIRKYNIVPYSRNPRIANTFEQMDFMEERGSGLQRMHDILFERGFPPPQFSFDNGFFVVTIFSAGTGIAPELQTKLTDRQKKILDFVIKNGKITNLICVEEFGISPRTALRDIQNLVSLGFFVPEGKGRSAYFVLSNNLIAP
jgi:ATP-dependent DNA helicase RecG